MPDLTELRDELARVCGWWRKEVLPNRAAWFRGSDDWRNAPDYTLDHPFEYGDLNALHTAIPKDANYTISRTSEGICELRSGWPVPYEGDPVMGEYEAIGRWLLAVLKENAHA